MRHLILESGSGIEKKIKLFIPFEFLKEMLTKGFPNKMAKSIEDDLIKDGSAVMNITGQVRITINTSKLKDKIGTLTLQSLEYVEISDTIVNSKEDIEKLNTFVKELHEALPNINFAIVSTWSQEPITNEIPKEVSGVLLDKAKWYLIDKNINFIRGLEGRAKLEPFWDTAHWAIGYGHMLSNKFQMGEKITIEEAESIYRKDLIACENSVKKCINVPMTLDMYAACVSFSYNGGKAGFRNSQTAKLINAGKYKEATEVWKTEKINAGTNTEKGLRRRREKEVGLFLSNFDLNKT